MSITQGIYRHCFKRVQVFPLFKAGDSLDRNNYKLFFSIGTVAKIFEKFIHIVLITQSKRELMKISLHHTKLTDTSHVSAN